MPPCPDDDALLQFVDGVDDGATRAHVRACNRCQVTVALFLQSSSTIGGTTLPGEELTADSLIAWIEDAQRRQAAALPSGTKIGRYAILRRAGSGGMGVVYLAYDPDLDRQVAIKLLHPDKSDDKRLLREARALAKVTHPNVVTVHDVGRVDEGFFVAMEFVEGQTLREWLRAERGVDRIVEALIEAARGLAAAHAAGLVHRDFKPDNVLVGDDGRVRVTDFGLARDHDPVRSQITQLGAVAGTPWYMAPEVQAGAQADARSDQYSFAVTLYQALVGHRPGLQLSEAGVPKRLRPALRRMLQPNPAERFASMAEVVHELDARRGRSRPLGPILAALALALVTGAIALWATRREEPVSARASAVAPTNDAAPASASVPSAESSAVSSVAPPPASARARPVASTPSRRNVPPSPAETSPSATPSSDPLSEF